mmetsp:Transcript_78383/g.224619  ORF Transcript_78383/g.224619 Transcript_78383/m.224619 type:complete len:207 (+) Transcript_78383:289-909(+)
MRTATTMQTAAASPEWRPVRSCLRLRTVQASTVSPQASSTTTTTLSPAAAPSAAYPNRRRAAAPTRRARRRRWNTGRRGCRGSWGPRTRESHRAVTWATRAARGTSPKWPPCPRCRACRTSTTRARCQASSRSRPRALLPAPLGCRPRICPAVAATSGRLCSLEGGRRWAFMAAWAAAACTASATIPCLSRWRTRCSIASTATATG